MPKKQIVQNVKGIAQARLLTVHVPNRRVIIQALLFAKMLAVLHRLHGQVATFHSGEISPVPQVHARVLGR
jgi:hypothetical protein